MNDLRANPETNSVPLSSLEPERLPVFEDMVAIPDSIVSVIIPTFNDGDLLFKTIDSVRRQTYSNLEIIVVDDASDESPEAGLDAIGDSRIKFYRFTKNKGPAVARNKGVEIARGRYLAFLDSDDLWTEEKIEKQVNFMKQTGAGIVYTKYTIIDEEGRFLGRSEQMPVIATYKKLLHHCFIRTSSLIYDIEKTRGKHYFPEIRKRQDYGMFLSLLKCSDAILLAEPLCSYRIRPGSVSSNKFKNVRFQWSVYRDIEKLPRSVSLYYCIQWFLRSGFVNLRRKYLTIFRRVMESS